MCFGKELAQIKAISLRGVKIRGQLIEEKIA